MPKVRFDLRDWLQTNHMEDREAYPWDSSARYLISRYHSEGLRPFAAFSGMWHIGEYECLNTQGIGYVLLFDDEFWLVEPKTKVEPLIFAAHKVASVQELDATAEWNHRCSNLRLNREWMWFSLFPVPNGGREAAIAFRRYL